MRKGCIVLMLFAISVCAACRRDDAHLPREEMVPILADLHLADAYSGLLRDTLHPNVGKNYDSLAFWTKSIFVNHHISQKEFSQSMDWYRDRPLELDSLYAKVIPVLERSKK